jgi:hypothetical protein
MRPFKRAALPLREPQYQCGHFAVWQKRLLDNDSTARPLPASPRPKALQAAGRWTSATVEWPTPSGTRSAGSRPR